MSLRVERVESICSTKGSTKKQYDPYRFLLDQISKCQPEKEPQPTGSFYDVLTSVAEAQEASRNMYKK